MESMTYNFDVAFSFLKEDLSFAFEIEKHLPSTVKTFIYADKQELLAGKDGPAKFRSVFSNEARVVVILYRSNYGNTQYTSVERDTISARALQTNWNFVILVPFEKPIPEWYPLTYIYTDPLNHRADQIASIIEYKLLELGAEFKQETLVDKAERIKKEKDFEQERLRILNTPRTMTEAVKLFDDFYKQLQERTTELGKIIDLRFSHNKTTFNGFRQTYGFHRVNDSARESYLRIVTEKVTFNDFNNKLLFKEEIKLDINQSKTLGWNYVNNIIDSETLVEKILTKLVELK